MESNYKHHNSQFAQYTKKRITPKYIPCGRQLVCINKLWPPRNSVAPHGGGGHRKMFATQM